LGSEAVRHTTEDERVTLELERDELVPRIDTRTGGTEDRDAHVVPEPDVCLWRVELGRQETCVSAVADGVRLARQHEDLHGEGRRGVGPSDDADDRGEHDDCQGSPSIVQRIHHPWAPPALGHATMFGDLVTRTNRASTRASAQQIRARRARAARVVDDHAPAAHPSPGARTLRQPPWQPDGVRALGAAVAHPTDPDIRLLDGDFYAGNPHRHFAWMRAHAPLYWDAAGGLWGVTLHEDVLRISRDPETFCSRHGSRPDSPAIPSMINMDDPDHRRRRDLVYKGLTPRRVAEHEPEIRAICRELIERVAARGACDFVRDLAAPLPMIVIGDILGVEPEDRDLLLRWSDDLIAATSATAPPTVLT